VERWYKRAAPIGARQSVLTCFYLDDGAFNASFLDFPAIFEFFTTAEDADRF
jgi:hypothetical protein